jgi:hypothetical protein
MSLRFSPAVTVLCLLAACSAPPLATKSSSSLGANLAIDLSTEVLNPDVHQETIQQTICVSGYTASVRPSTTYTNGVKLKLLREQGLPQETTKEYELDHHIPLALGGHPRNPRNLILQRWDGPDGAKAKDRLEVRLQKLVCAGKVSLGIAQRDIYLDWQGAFRKYVSP